MEANPAYAWEEPLGPSSDYRQPTKDEQIDYWQERYFRLQDEHAACLNQLQAIRRLLDDPESDKS